jgi:hypothetical protein
MSNRIANAPDSHFHVLPKLAHALLAKACLSVLLQLDNESEIWDFPLASYSAKHWVDRALFEDASSDIRDGMDCLFDENRPHFVAWIWANDLDDHDFCDHPYKYESTAQQEQPHAFPLYYPALFGSRGLTERLL